MGQGLPVGWWNEKRDPGWLDYIGDDVLPSWMCPGLNSHDISI